MKPEYRFGLDPCPCGTPRRRSGQRDGWPATPSSRRSHGTTSRRWRGANLISTQVRCGRGRARRRQFVAGLDLGQAPGPSFLLERSICFRPGSRGTGSGRTRKNRRSLRDRRRFAVRSPAYQRFRFSRTACANQRTGLQRPTRRRVDEASEVFDLRGTVARDATGTRRGRRRGRTPPSRRVI